MVDLSVIPSSRLPNLGSLPPRKYFKGYGILRSVDEPILESHAHRTLSSLKLSERAIVRLLNNAFSQRMSMQWTCFWSGML